MNAVLLLLTGKHSSSDGKRLFAGQGMALGIGWDAITGEKLFTIKVTQGQCGKSIFGAAFPLDGKRLAVVHRIGLISIRDAGSGKELLTWRGHMGRIEAVTFSPDGNLVASVAEDGTARVWDVATGLNVLNLPVNSGGPAMSPSVRMENGLPSVACQGFMFLLYQSMNW